MFVKRQTRRYGTMIHVVYLGTQLWKYHWHRYHTMGKGPVFRSAGLRVARVGGDRYGQNTVSDAESRGRKPIAIGVEGILHSGA